MAQVYVLEREVVVPRRLDEVFAFFADARNLEKLTPPFLKFQILTPGEIEMRPGTLIDYRIRLHGIPIRWRTLIEEWEPPFQFVDVQLKGPYRLWRHTHRFEEVPEGTRVSDRVEYTPPGGALVHRLFVRPDVERIFAYRQESLQERFPDQPL